MKSTKSVIVEGFVFSMFILIVVVIVDLMFESLSWEKFWKTGIISLIGGFLYALIVRSLSKRIKS